MKCNPLRWLWGLLPIALLSWFVVQFEHTGIEADLTKRVAEQLGGSGFKWARTAFSGRDGVITGMAADEADPGRAYDIALSVWGVRVVDNRADTIEKVAAYSWTAVRTANKIQLGGYVPSDSARADIVKAAKASFPGAEVADEMKLARGVPTPDVWLSGVNFGLKQLSGLKSGQAKLDMLNLSVSGDAADLKGYKAVKTALASELPKGLKLVDDRVSAPVVKPFVWSARHAGGQIALSGYVPGGRARADILAAAKAAFPRSQIVDRMEVAEGAASGHSVASLAALKELGHLEEGSAEIRDASLTVSGMAADAAIADAAKQGLVKANPQGFKLTEAIKFRDTVPKPVSPYTTSIIADAATVVLTGYAPTDAAGEQLVQNARNRFAGRRIDNRLEIAPGAPDGWARCFDGALAGVQRLGNGKLAMIDRRIDISASTDDEALASMLPGEMKAALTADCDASVRVDVLAEAPPDLVWRATYAGSEVVLEGDVSSVDAKASLVATAKRIFAGKAVTDRMRVVETRTRKWPTVAEQGLISLAELQKGEAMLVRQQLTVSGEAKDTAIVTRIRERLGRTLASGYSGLEKITVAAAAPPTSAPPSPAAAPPAPPKVDIAAQQCQSALQATAREGMIRFERASAVLTKESFATLDRLAAVARNCPDMVIEIEGHTDSEGTPERNQKLSDRRAQSVVDYMIKGGIDQKHLNAVGYGETRPLVPNDTPVNRANNRRIEFTVKPR